MIDTRESSLANLELLTPQQVAKALGISVRTIEKMRTAGSSLKFVRVGRRVLYDPADVRGYIDANKYNNTSQAQVRSHAA